VQPRYWRKSCSASDTSVTRCVSPNARVTYIGARVTPSLAMTLASMTFGHSTRAQLVSDSSVHVLGEVSPPKLPR